MTETIFHKQQIILSTDKILKRLTFYTNRILSVLKIDQVTHELVMDGI